MDTSVTTRTPSALDEGFAASTAAVTALATVPLAASMVRQPVVRVAAAPTVILRVYRAVDVVPVTVYDTKGAPVVATVYRPPSPTRTFSPTNRAARTACSDDGRMVTVGEPFETAEVPRRASPLEPSMPGPPPTRSTSPGARNCRGSAAPTVEMVRKLEPRVTEAVMPSNMAFNEYLDGREHMYGGQARSTANEGEAWGQ